MVTATKKKAAAKRPCRPAVKATVKPAAQKGAKTTKPAGTATCPGGQSLLDPALYLNRELTWLAFDSRVLHEARGRAHAAARAGEVPGHHRREPRRVLHEAHRRAQAAARGRRPEGHRRRAHARAADPGLPRGRPRAAPADGAARRAPREAAAGRAGSTWPATTSCRRTSRPRSRAEYVRSIYPLVTPQSIDPAHPFPFVSNLSLNLLVTLRYPGDAELSLARVKVPVGAGARRFLRVGAGQRFVRLEEVLCHNLDLLFPGMEIVRCELFRVTRNANAEKSEEGADDLLAMIESELQERRFAPIVRLEVIPGMDPAHRGRLASELDLDEAQDVFEVDGMFALRDLHRDRRAAAPGAQGPGPPPDRPPAAADRAQHLPRDPRRRLDPAAAPLRGLRVLARALPQGGRRGPQGARDQDDALPHREREQHPRAPDRRGPQRQAGGGRRRAQGALRRGGQHPPGQPDGGGGDPRHLRRRRA